MHANEPEMAKKWEKEEAIKGKLQNLIKQEIKSINEGFDKYYLSSLLDSKLKKKLEIAIKNLKGKIDGVGDDWIWFRMPSANLDLLTALITKLDRNKNVLIGDKRKNNIWDRRQKINKLEATTTSAVPPHDTPMAFKKSTQKAIDTDDEDDEKNESINERKLSSHQKKAILIAIQMSGNMTGATKKIEKIKKGLSNDKKVKDALRLANESINEDNIKFSKEEMAQLHKDGKIEKDGHTIEFGESINESDLGLTYKKGKTVKVTHKKSGKELVIIDKPNVKREYEKIGFFAEGTVNELSMAPFSSQEAKLHINADIRDMSKLLGKTSQKVIKIMMDGVKGGKYTAMDIARGVKEGPAGRTHFGELTFIQSLWNKVRDKFRRYSKHGKLS